MLQVHWRARDGQKGQGKGRTGVSGDDVFVDVPPGTVVRTTDGQLVGELTEPEQVSWAMLCRDTVMMFQWLLCCRLG